jgi:hypothetical protein
VAISLAGFQVLGDPIGCVLNRDGADESQIGEVTELALGGNPAQIRRVVALRLADRLRGGDRDQRAEVVDRLLSPVQEPLPNPVDRGGGNGRTAGEQAFLETDEAFWDRVIDVNYKGVVNRNGEPQLVTSGGRIVGLRRKDGSVEPLPEPPIDQRPEAWDAPLELSPSGRLRYVTPPAAPQTPRRMPGRGVRGRDADVTCSVESCDRRVFRHRLCERHHRAARRDPRTPKERWGHRPLERRRHPGRRVRERFRRSRLALATNVELPDVGASGKPIETLGASFESAWTRTPLQIGMFP